MSLLRCDVISRFCKISNTNDVPREESDMATDNLADYFFAIIHCGLQK